MKRLFFYLLLSTIVATNLFANNSQEKETKTTIKEVTVFQNGCQITRTQNVDIVKGTQTLKFTGLSPYLDESSVRIKMNKEAVILSVNFNLNYKKTNEERDKQMEKLKEQIKSIDEQIVVEGTNKTVINDELSFFSNNMKIGGTEGIQAAQMKEIHQYYSKRISELRLNSLEVDKRIKQLADEKSKLGKEYNELSSKDTYPDGELLVKIDADKTEKVTFEISYMASNASWIPSYDIIAKNTSSPIELIYKAEVKQDTKEDWKDVKVKLSSTVPKNINQKIKLDPYHISYNYRGANYSRYENTAIGAGSGTLQGTVIDRTTYEPVPFANVVALNANGIQVAGAITDFDGNYIIKSLPTGLYTITVSHIGYHTQSNFNVRIVADQTVFSTFQLNPEVIDIGLVETIEYDVPLIQKDKTMSGGVFSREVSNNRSQRSSGEVQYIDGIRVTGSTSLPQSAYDPSYKNISPTTQTQNTTSFEFEIESLYSIPSDNKNYTILIDEYVLPTTYKHFTVPKISLEAYLTAELTNWNKYNLLSGNSNIFFENTFIGKSYIETQHTSDTLEIFLGKDNGIVVKRDLEKTSSGSNLIGNKFEETKTWKISVRNNKNTPVTLNIYDQVPVSIINDITVKLLNISEGKLDEDSGEVVWDIKLAPTETKDFELKYSVRYPSSRRVYVE